MFPIKRTLKAANRSHNMSAANFRKWKAEGFAPSKSQLGVMVEVLQGRPDDAGKSVE